MPHTLVLSALLLVLASLPSKAVLLDAGDGTGNTSASSDPWQRMGTKTPCPPACGLSFVYLGNGWMITANHVGPSDVLMTSGETYPALPGSEVRIGGNADLLVFRIAGNPKLPALPILEIVQTTPSIGTPVVMVGRGRNRGDCIAWSSPQQEYCVDGYEWAPGATMRWGTNRVADPAAAEPVPTNFIVTDFSNSQDPQATGDEAQAVVGDSGGAILIQEGPIWKLAGVVFTVSVAEGQPPQTSFFGNLTYAADLASYRDEIVSIVRPECSDETDNDADGLVDLLDPDCPNPEGPSETAAPVPALNGVGSLFAAAGLLELGRRRSPVVQRVPRAIL